MLKLTRRFNSPNIHFYYFILVVLACAVMYIALALTPSHYAKALNLLGVPTEPLFGKARAVRSDDWAVLTPYFQIAVLGNGSTTDLISPYHSSLKAIWPLPIMDWSILFKPQLWSFWIFPPAYAFSLYFCLYWVSCVIGYTVLFKQLRSPLLLSIFGAIIIYSSHFVQVWWTTHAAVFAFAPWPAIVFLSNIRTYIKIPLLYWVTTFYIFSDLYPAFIISGSFAFLVMVIAYRKDALTIKNIAIGAATAVAAVATLYLYFGDLFFILKNTVYPGSRYMSGGGVVGSRMLAHIFPFFTTSNFNPVLANSNQCEIAVISTFLPLTFICFADYSRALRYFRNHLKEVLIVGSGLFLMLLWMTVPVPASWGRLFLWTNVPGTRMVWGFGLLLSCALIISATSVSLRFSWLRWTAFSTSLIVSFVISKLVIDQTSSNTDSNTLRFLLDNWFDWIAIILFAMAGLCILLTRATAHSSYIFAAAAFSGVITFSTFNPIQTAHPIFETPHSAKLDQFRASAKENPNGWVVVPGIYGATINGVGIPSINHVLLAPELKFFKKFFTDMPETEFNNIFNRYHHVSPDITIETPFSPQSDVVRIPLKRFQQRPPF